MSLGCVFLESIASGVITEQEIALAIRLGRLLDEGQINLGCRLA